jgi:hypothetical protein
VEGKLCVDARQEGGTEKLVPALIERKQELKNDKEMLI